MKGLRSPRKAIIGPWAHKYPHFAVPEPRIGFLQEALRWWDQWLKGAGHRHHRAIRTTAIYVMDAVEARTASPSTSKVAGSATASGASAHVDTKKWYLNADGHRADGPARRRR